MAATPNDNTLHIRRCHATYRVATGHPAPELVKHRLDAVYRRDFADALAAYLEPLFAQSDGSVWLIRRLDLDVMVNYSWESDRIGRRWAASFARAVGDALLQGDDGENVRHFADDAAYLGQFLVDLADGFAWSRWYYRSFHGLRLLPTATALRTALCDSPSTGLDALLGLTPFELGKVLAALTPVEAGRVLDHLTTVGPGLNVPASVEAVWAVWDAVRLDPTSLTDEGRIALHFFVSACRIQRSTAGPPLRNAVLALLSLARSMTLAPWISRSILDALTTGDLAELYRAAGASEAERLAPLLRCTPAWLRQAADLLQPTQAAARTSADLSRQTAWGGVFLLLPAIDEFVAGLGGKWPDLDDLRGADLLRFVLLLKCLGQARALASFRDPLLRDLLHIPPALTMTDLARWQGGIGKAIRAQAHSAADRERAVQPFRTPVHDPPGRVFILARLTAAGRSLLLLVDGQSGVWQGAVSDRARRLAWVARWLRPWLHGSEGAVVLTDASWAESLAAADASLQMEPLESEIAQRMAAGDAHLAASLAQRPSWQADLDYLRLPFDAPRGVDLALSLWTQRILRSFAWRLPGFAFSSLPYLYHNFLDLPATVEDGPGRRVVRLGRPPLNLVLSLTGMTRATYRIDALDERPFVLFQDS